MTSQTSLPSLLSLILLLPYAAAQTTTTTAPSTTPTVTRVLEVFYLNQRIQEEGLPYTYTPKISGSVLAVDTVSNLTTIVVTATRTVPSRGASRSRLPSEDTTLSAPEETITAPVFSALPPSDHHHPGGDHRHGPGNKSWRFNITGQPTTITQGPTTFEFTGTRFGPDHSIINRCSLNSTTSAACNITYLGTAWYTGRRNGNNKEEWNGTFSTHSYNWTAGDRFGYAPVTLTAGVELLSAQDGAGSPTGAGGNTSAASRSTWKNDGGMMRIAVVGLGLGWSVIWLGWLV